VSQSGDAGDREFGAWPLDRTQEVAGSSPASSTGRNPCKWASAVRRQSHQAQSRSSFVLLISALTPNLSSQHADATEDDKHGRMRETSGSAGRGVDHRRHACTFLADTLLTLPAGIRPTTIHRTDRIVLAIGGTDLHLTRVCTGRHDPSYTESCVRSLAAAVEQSPISARVLV
jgi:hypothetical protein